MKSLYTLFERFVLIIQRRGFKAGLTALFKFLATKYDELKYSPLKFYYNTRHIELVLRKIHGNKMYLKVNDTGLSRQLLLHGTRERMQTSLVKKLVKPGMRVMEIGANLGYYALIEASIVGKDGRVYAIEPIPENYGILCKNVRENNFEDRVELYCCAVSDTCSVSKIAQTRESNLATMLLNKAEMSDCAEKKLQTSLTALLDVETITLDSFLKDKAPVDFIRMDAEGYEIKIAKGMAATLKKAKKGTKIFMEIHPILFKEPLTTVREIMQDLTNSGFEVKYIVDSTGSKLLDFSKDNVLETICYEPEWAPSLFLEKV